MNKLSHISNKEVDWMKLVHQYFDDLSYTKHGNIRRALEYSCTEFSEVFKS